MLMTLTTDGPVCEAKAELFKALGHPARIRVLELLGSGERTMGELAEGSGMELSHLSQHVATLRRAGVVDSRRVRSTVLCTLRDPMIAELLGVARQLLSANLRQGQALLAALDEADGGAPAPAAAPPTTPVTPTTTPVTA